MQKTKNHFLQQLAACYTQGEIDELFLLAVEKVCSLSRTEILLNNNSIITPPQVAQLQQIVAQLQQGEPIQYILGQAWFYGMKFWVDKNVLIPRPETEELAEWILTNHPQATTVLDIGTGSGCIAIALAVQNPKYAVSALDISADALTVARKNAELYRLNINFLQADILQIPTLAQQWDVIVSNPPYIPAQERIAMHKTVTEHEPQLALFVPDDKPLLFYEKIAQFAQKHLKPHGKIYLEIHRDFGKETIALLQKLNFQHITLRKDLAGNNRMIQAEIL